MNNDVFCYKWGDPPIIVTSDAVTNENYRQIPREYIISYMLLLVPIHREFDEPPIQIDRLAIIVYVGVSRLCCCDVTQTYFVTSFGPIAFQTFLSSSHTFIAVVTLIVTH